MSNKRRRIRAQFNAICTHPKMEADAGWAYRQIQNLFRHVVRVGWGIEPSHPAFTELTNMYLQAAKLMLKQYVQHDVEIYAQAAYDFAVCGRNHAQKSDTMKVIVAQFDELLEDSAFSLYRQAT